MCHNALFSSEEVWSVIQRVKNDYNRQKLTEIWSLCQDFVPKYTGCSIDNLQSVDFMKDYLPLLKKMKSQSAGKKLLVSYCGNPYIGVTKSIVWMYWMPTKVGSKAAMKLLDSYIEELEDKIKQHQYIPKPKITIIKSPTSKLGKLIELPDTTNDSGLVNDQNSSQEIGTDQDSIHNHSIMDTESELNLTTGIGTQADGFSSSDGEIEQAIINRAHEVSLLHMDEEIDFRPSLNSTAPITPSSTTKPSNNAPGKRRQSMKGTRRSFRGQGLNLSTSGAFESMREAGKAVAATPSVTDIPDFVFADPDLDDVFEALSDQSWEEIPSGDNMPDLEGSD